MEEHRETWQGEKVGAVGMEGLLTFELDPKTCIVAERKNFAEGPEICGEDLFQPGVSCRMRFWYLLAALVAGSPNDSLQPHHTPMANLQEQHNICLYLATGLHVSNPEACLFHLY